MLKDIVVFATLFNQVKSSGWLCFHHTSDKLYDILANSVFGVPFEKIQYFISCVP